MPPKTKYKKVYKKRSYKKSALAIAKRSLRKVNKLAKVVYNEQKMHDILSTSITPIIAGTVTHLSGIAQGNTVTTRDGLSIHAFFHEFRMTIFKHATPPVTNIRIAIIVDTRQEESVFPSFLDVFLQATPIAQWSRVNPKRFKVLFNKLFTLRTNRIALIYKQTKKLNLDIKWVGATIGSITKNGIYLLTETDAAAAQEPTMRFTYRLRYNDV